MKHIHIKTFLYFFIISTYFVTAKQSTLLQPFTVPFYINLFLSLFFVLFAGLCSGLTVGYLSIKKQTLRIWLDSDDNQKIQKAQTILQILQNHHLLLSTLLFCNAVSMEALPIFLDRIIPSYLAILVSTVCVLLFGQVLPQAYCTGAKQIQIAYFFSSFVKFLQFSLGLVVKPIAWVLDRWIGVGEEKIIFKKQNIKTLLRLHNSKQYGYRPQEIEMLQNTLDLREKNVKDYMIPINRIFMLDLDKQIDNELIDLIKKYNYSTIPIFCGDYNNIKGTIKTKNLVDFDKNCTLKTIERQDPVFIDYSANLLQAFELLNKYKKKIGFLKQNHKIVSNSNQRQVIGIITIKRIFQQITLKQFQDDDNRKKFTSKQFVHKTKKNVKRSQQILEAQQQI